MLKRIISRVLFQMYLVLHVFTWKQADGTFIHLDKWLPICSRNAKRPTQMHVYGSYGIKFGLALVGVCLADLVTKTAGVLLPHPFNIALSISFKEQKRTTHPLWSNRRGVGSCRWLFALCCTFLQVALTGN